MKRKIFGDDTNNSGTQQRTALKGAKRNFMILILFNFFSLSILQNFPLSIIDF